MKGSIRVTNKRKHSTVKPTADETVIDGDRNNPVLGNSHILKNPNDDKERERVIDAYLDDVATDLDARGPIQQECQRLAYRVAGGEKIALACWCTPKPCHLDVIVDMVMSAARILVKTQTIQEIKNAIAKYSGAANSRDCTRNSERRNYRKQGRTSGKTNGEDASQDPRRIRPHSAHGIAKARPQEQIMMSLT